MDYRVEDETGPCNGVKGAVDVYDPPLEARVPRLDRCCLKQKVGYGRDTAPKTICQKTGLTTHATRGSVAKTPYFSWKISCLARIMGEIGDSGHSLGLDQLGIIRVSSVDYPLFEMCLFRS